MLQKDLTSDIKTRLTTIRGQIGGLIQMLDNETDLEKLITQFKAVSGGLDTAYNLLLDDVYRKALALKIVEVVESCPGNCGNEEKIDFIKARFPKFELNELVEKFKEITEIGVKIKADKEKNF